MTGNPECDTLWSGSHIQKRPHDSPCSSWEEEGDQRRLGGEELEAEPITLDRCIVTDLDWKPWSVVECFIKTSQHVSVLHSVAAASLHVGGDEQRGEVAQLELPRVPRMSSLFKLQSCDAQIRTL